MKLIAALALTLYVSTLSIASADECPVKFETDYIEKVAALATNAGSCYEASQVVNACALGAGGDVYTVGAAYDRCAQDLPVMSKKDEQTFAYLKSKCNEKYDSMDGSMYRSANAFCHLSIVELFVNLLSKED